jgi:PAS domain S-box-containing protein
MTENKQKQYGLPKSTLAGKFILFILLFSSVITIIGTSLQLYLDYKEDKSSIQNTLNLIETTHLQSIVNNLWVNDKDRLSVQMDEILSFPDIQYIAIHLNSEETITAGTKKSTKILSRVYPLVYSFRDQIVNLGNLQVEATLENAFLRLRSRVVVILLTQGIKTFLVSLFIFFVFHLLIGRHLAYMANYSKDFNLNRLDDQLTLSRSPKTSTNDELETLVISINEMRSNLQRDMAERKQSESALLESEERFKALADTSPLAIYMSTGIEQEAVYINPTFTKLFGYTMEEVPTVGKWYPLAYPDEKYRSQFVEGWQEKVEKAIETNSEIAPMEALVTCKDGSKKIISWGFINIGKQSWAFGLNLTKQKQAEEEKFNLENRLQQAQKMEAIGTLAGGIAHDFNNILSAIIGYTEMARDDSPNESSVAKDLDNVLEASTRAVSLVKQILSFSRQDETEYILLQPASIVTKAVTLLRPSLPTTIKITQDIDTKTGLIFGDPTQIHQILMNLCTNAFHAMEDTGGILDLSVKEIDLSSEDLTREPHIDAGTFIQLSVGDSGAGIPLEVRDKIFDPYFTTKEVGKGTGMGLSIIHGIVKSYGGFITLNSELEQGTVFHVFLPVVNKEELPAREATQQIPVGIERVLFIDDEDVLADMGKNMLERLGYHVTVRKSSLEALETFQNQPDQFDVVITDQTMPGMTGIDLTRRMLQIRPDIPIILCTGYSSIISEEKAKSVGVREFALKPVGKRDIAMLIRKVLNGNHA